MKYPIPLSVRSEIVPSFAVLAAIVTAIVLAPSLPETIATHWNVQGEVDGWMSASSALIIFPLFVLGIYLLLLAVPLLDPRKERYADFAKAYHVLKGSIVLLMAGIFIMVFLNGAGYDVPVGTITPIAIGALFMIIGNYLGKVKMNWMVGVRTPWTLSDEEVWNKSHRLAGRLFVVGGVLMIANAFVPVPMRIPLFIGILVLVALVPVVYSYVLYVKTKKG